MNIPQVQYVDKPVDVAVAMQNTVPTVERADLAEAQKSLAAVLASAAASKNSCALVAADHEVSVKPFAEVLKALVSMSHRSLDQRVALLGDTRACCSR